MQDNRYSDGGANRVGKHRSPLFRVATLIVAIGMAVGLGVVLRPSTASASTHTVTNCNDSGAGSLRQAVASASSGDTINFAPSPSCSTITLTSGVIEIATSLTINGPGASVLAVSGNEASGVLQVDGGVTATVSGLTVENGRVDINGVGGGILNNGTLTVSDSTLHGNSAGNPYGGGGIGSYGHLTVTNSTFSGNIATDGLGGGIIIETGGSGSITGSTFSTNTAAGNAYGGGGVYNAGSLTISDSTFSNNAATAGIGGGITNAGPLTITNSTFSKNSSAGNGFGGAGIFNAAMLELINSVLVGNDGENIAQGGGLSNGGDATVLNTTFANNVASSGGAIFNYAGSLTLASSTLSDNSAGTGGGVYSDGGTSHIGASIVAGSTNGQDCVGPISDLGYNLDDDGTCGLTTANADFSTTNPLLAASGPQDNGGPTQTIALAVGSPAIDHINNASLCPATDQRGFARTTPCDIGAYDTDGGLQITTVSLSNATRGASYTAPLAATGGNPPYTWKLSKGSARLPKGLKLNKSTGVILGTPKTTAKSSTFTVEVLDKKVKVKHRHPTQNTATKMLSIAIS